MPALHCASTRRGVDTMNMGAPMTGSRKRPCRISGMGIYGSAPGRIIDEFPPLWLSRAALHTETSTPLHPHPRSTNTIGIIMKFDTLLLERRDAVAYVTLNRPDELHALNR